MTWPGARSAPRSAPRCLLCVEHSCFPCTNRWLTKTFLLRGLSLLFTSERLHYHFHRFSVTFQNSVAGPRVSDPKAGFWLLGKVLKEAAMGHGVKEVGESTYLACWFFLHEWEKSQEQANKTVVQSVNLFPVLVLSVKMGFLFLAYVLYCRV